ncbi:MAG: flagellar protein FlaG [Gammaproteobacteria bacterium]
MINEINNTSLVSVTPGSVATAENKSVAFSESGKQVPPPGRAQPQEASDKPAASKKDLQKAVERFSERAKSMGRELKFEVDEDSGQTVVKVIDPETDEVVRQIPGEEVIERAASKDSSAMNIVDDTA